MRNSRALSAQLVAILLLSGAAQASGEVTLRVDELLEFIDLAPAVAIAENQLEQALVELEAAHVPVTAELRGGYTQNLDGNGFYGDLAPIELAATLNVISAGPVQQRREAAQRNMIEAEVSLRHMRSATMILVLEQYLSLKRTRELAVIAEREQLLAGQLVQARTLDLDAGTANFMDLQEAALNVEQAAHDLVGLRNQERQQLRSLAVTLGVDSIQVDTSESLVLSGCPLPIVVESNRLDITQAEHNYLSAAEAVAAARRQSGTQVGLQVTGRVTGSTALSFDTRFSTTSLQPVVSVAFDPSPPASQTQGGHLSVGVTATIPVGTATQPRSELLEVDSAAWRLQAATRQAEAAIAAAEHQRARANSDVHLTMQQFHLANQQLEHARERAELGLITPLDVLTAEIRSHTAQLNFETAQDQQLLATLNLLHELAIHPGGCVQTGGN